MHCFVFSTKQFEPWQSDEDMEDVLPLSFRTMSEQGLSVAPSYQRTTSFPDQHFEDRSSRMLYGNVTPGQCAPQVIAEMYIVNDYNEFLFQYFLHMSRLTIHR